VVVVVIRIQDGGSVWYLGTAGTVEMIEMRVDRCRSVPGVDMLKGRQKERHQQCRAGL
jgi:hypothetical protein